MFTKSFVLFPQFKFCSGLCLQKSISSAPRNNYKQQFVVKYKEITSKSIRYYKKVRVGALADQEMGRWWSITSSIMSPEINLKCSQKKTKTKKIRGAYSALHSPAANFGSLRSPHIHNHMRIKIQL